MAMFLKMKTSIGGPHYSLALGDEVPFDEAFPFTANEVRRFIDPAGANIAEFVGDTADLDAWLAQWAPPLPALLGSSILPAIVKVAGYQIQLGGIVVEAFAVFRGERCPGAGELEAVDAWNGRPEAEREADLAAVIDRLAADPDNVERVILDTSIVARPEPAATSPAETPVPAAPAETPAPAAIAPAAAAEIAAPVTPPAKKKR
jgi:hypothetical protein